MSRGSGSRARAQRAAVAVVALACGLVLSQAATSSIAAPSAASTVSFPTSTAAIEYGQSWYFPVSMDYAAHAWVYNGSYTIEQTGTPASYVPDLQLYYNSTTGTFDGTLSAPYEAPALAPGTYTFAIVINGTDAASLPFTERTEPAARLTISAAPLGVETRVVPDAANPAAAVVSARFTGGFVDLYGSSFYPWSGLSPAGAWHFTITDSTGAVVDERSVDRAAGDDTLAASFLWLGAEAGEQYSLATEFTASGASAANFSITNAADFAFTAPASGRTAPASAATGSIDDKLAEPAGFGLPLWSLITGGLATAGLAALVAIFGIRLRRSPMPSANVPMTTTKEGTA